MKVRIGNDICLHVNLLGNKNVDAVNINSINAYLVNVTKQYEIAEEQRHMSIRMHDEMQSRKDRIKYVSRFPMEPYMEEYFGTPYDICHSGHPAYRVYPSWYFPAYGGFGVYPHSFEPHHSFMWAKDDMRDLHAKMDYKQQDLKEQYDRCEFLCPVEATDSKNKVDVFFPAEAQLFTGTYKLIIVARLYEPGYSPNNLRTVTMDYENVFTLVSRSDEEGVDSAVEITIGNMKQVTSINVTGNTAIPVGGTGKLIATVFPADIDDDGVIWTIPEDADTRYIAIINTDDTSCKFMGLGLPAGASRYTATIKCTSRKTPSVSADVKVTIMKELDLDVYTFKGDLGNHNVNLNLTDGQTVSIDVSKETAWYEGD